MRGVLVLQGLSRQLEQEARSAAPRPGRTGRRDQGGAPEAPKLAAAQAAQAAEAEALDRQIAAAQAQRRQAETEAGKRLRAGWRRGRAYETLRAVLGTLEAQRRRKRPARERRPPGPNGRNARPRRRQRGGGGGAGPPGRLGTIAAGAQPKGQLVAPVTGRGSRLGRDDRRRPGLRHLLQYAARGARDLALWRAGRVRRSNFRSYGSVVDRRLRRRLPCRAGRLRTTWTSGRPDSIVRPASRWVMPIGNPDDRPSAVALCRIAARWPARKPGTLAQSQVVRRLSAVDVTTNEINTGRRAWQRGRQMSDSNGSHQVRSLLPRDSADHAPGPFPWRRRERTHGFPPAAYWRYGLLIGTAFVAGLGAGPTLDALGVSSLGRRAGAGQLAGPTCTRC